MLLGDLQRFEPAAARRPHEDSHMGSAAGWSILWALVSGGPVRRAVALHGRRAT